jgi:hypothetical protein
MPASRMGSVPSEICRRGQRLSKSILSVRRSTKPPTASGFKEVSGICDRLAALASHFDTAFTKQIEYTSPFGENWEDSSKNAEKLRYQAHYRIAPLFSLLGKHERELKDDIRKAVAVIQTKLGPAKNSGDVEDARAYALAIQQEISKSIDEINKLSYQIAGSSSVGATAILTPEEMQSGLSGALSVS